MRKSFLPVLVYLVGFIILIRLINLQIFSKKYDKLSIKNSVLKQNIYPERGFIFDRNGKLLVSNQPMYDLMVIPNSLKSFDTTELSNLTGMEMKKISENLIRAKKYSIRAFILLFLTIFLIAEPNAAQGDIDKGQIIKATKDIKIIARIRFPSFGKKPDAAILDIVQALGFTI